MATRRNPDDALTTILLILAGGAIVLYGVQRETQGIGAAAQGVGGALGATGQGLGGALGNTGQAAGQTLGAIGGDVSGGLGAVGGWLSELFHHGGAPAATAPISGAAGSPPAGWAQLATQWRRAAAANPSGSSPDDWNAFRAFAQQIGAGDPGMAPFAGWPQGYGGSVSFGVGNPYG